MAYTYDELASKSLDELRKIAAAIDSDAVKGYSQLNKQHLIKMLCAALSVSQHATRQVVGIDKGAIKARIKDLKKKRDEILASAEKTQLKTVLRQIHQMKRQIRKATM